MLFDGGLLFVTFFLTGLRSARSDLPFNDCEIIGGDALHTANIESNFNDVGVFGDLDSDGGIDLLARDATKAYRVFKQTSSRTFGSSTEVLDATTALSKKICVNAGPVDLDKDGFNDIIFAGAGTVWGSNRGTQDLVYFGTADTGALGTMSSVDLSGNELKSSNRCVVADFDGDNTDDIAMVNIYFGERDVVFLNQGARSFASAAVVSTSGFGHDIVAADVDKDGNIDLVVAQSDSAGEYVLFGNGDGTFSDAYKFNTGSVGAIAVCDLNGDGYPDVVVGDYYSFRGIKVYLNAGSGAARSGTFPTATTVSNAFQQVYGIACGDVDGDGDNDVVIAQTSGNAQYFENFGDGVLSSTPVEIDSMSEAGMLLLYDVDGDGYLDLLGGGKVCFNAAGAISPPPSSSPPSPPPSFIDAGTSHTCIVQTGKVKCWGYNSKGQLGDGTTTTRSTPVEVTGITTARSVAIGAYESCAVLSEGKVKCWGDNENGGLGDGTTTDRYTPVEVSGITTATQVAVSYDHSCALLSDGKVTCWGLNDDGQLGDGSTTDSTTPVEVSDITTATSIAVGSDHSCALLSDKTIKCWGSGGRIADGTFTDRSTPVEISGITTATSIVTNWAHSCAVLTDGTIECWGYNSNGQLGDGTTTDSFTSLVMVSGITTAKSIDTGFTHSCAVLTDGKVKCWGQNVKGQLGDGTTIDRTIPVEVSGITTATSIVLGYDHSCAVLTGGTAKCWGDNSAGELGDGTKTDRSTPVEVTILLSPPPPSTTTTSPPPPSTTTTSPPPPSTTTTSPPPPPPPPSYATVPPEASSDQSNDQSSSPTGAIVGSLVGIVILFPSTTFTILAMCFKPYLRKKLLQYGWRRTADIFVPDVKGELRTMSVKVAELEAFLAKQRLPRIKDVTPEINPSDVTHREKDVLGSGGYGYVLKGAFKGEPVAIKAVFGNDMKSVPASVTKMMRREAMIMCSLNHPNILKIHGVVSERGWIIMELCEGGALDEVLYDPEFVLDHPTRLRIAAETATGIAYLHLSDVSIVHGDMKAGNVLLTKDLSVRICDFGMSEAKNRSKTMTVAASSSGKGGTALTVAWSAPELFMDRPKSFATDIYALGLTLWEIYERRVPFGNMPEAAVVNQVLSGRRPEIASTEMPEEIKKLIQLCWSEDPRERPAADKIAFILTRLWNVNTERQRAVAQAAAAAEKKKAEEAEAAAAAEKKKAEEAEAKDKATKLAEEAKAEKLAEEAEKPAAQAFCSNCGAKLTGGKFCAECGKKC